MIFFIIQKKEVLNVNLSELIKQKRKENGMTLEQLGKRVGVSKMTVLRWESGEIKNIRTDKIEKLASALGIPVVALFEGFNKNNNTKKNIQQVTPDEFFNEVVNILNKTDGLSDQQKKHILNTLDFICNDDEK